MKTKVLTPLSAAVLFMTVACSPDLGQKYIVPEDMNPELGHEMIVLGRQLEDPYSVANVTKALNSLFPTKAAQIGPLEPTHYYVRVLPESEEEVEALLDMGLDLLDHPMDYEILKEGDYYHDPSIPQEDITWLYAALPVDASLPEGLRFEVLDECVIIGEGSSTKSSDGIDWEAVERESFRLTGNESMLSTKASKTSAVPKGRITVTDSSYDSEPVGLAGVKVCANVFVKTAKGFTDEEGYYELDRSFASDPRYRIEFTNRKGFSIGLNLILIKASVSTLGKNPAEGCSVNITSETGGHVFARSAVNNSAYYYFDSCKRDGAGMKTPPQNLRIWLCSFLSSSATPMLQQGVMLDSDLVASMLGDYVILAQIFLPDVIIGMDGKTDFASYYATTVHELAHASHFMLAGREFWNRYVTFMATSYFTSSGLTYGTGTELNAGYCEVGEMWAYYMQTVLYNERYPNDEQAFGTTHWFHPQIFSYLDSRGLGRYSIYPVLTSETNSRNMLRDKLISYYPEMKNVINQAFNRYL